MFSRRKRKSIPTSDDAPSVLLVGHCKPDAWFLKMTAARALPGAQISIVNSMQDVERAIDDADLLMVNRVLDGSFGTESGVELIGRLRDGADRAPALMLISDIPGAQEQAEQAGAVPGFGKSEAGSDLAHDRLRSAVSLEDDGGTGL